MRRFTTPSILFEVGADLTGCEVHLTLRQGRREIDITEFDSMEVSGDTTTVAVTLTQRQTAKFSEKQPVEAQFNIVDQNGYRVPSDVVKIAMEKQLLEREV